MSSGTKVHEREGVLCLVDLVEAEHCEPLIGDELGIEWRIELSDGKLTLQRPKFDSRILDRDLAGSFAFVHQDDTTRVTYRLDFQDGVSAQAAGFTVSSGRLAGIKFTRVR